MAEIPVGVYMPLAGVASGPLQLVIPTKELLDAIVVEFNTKFANMVVTQPTNTLWQAKVLGVSPEATGLTAYGFKANRGGWLLNAVGGPCEQAMQAFAAANGLSTYR